MAQLLLQGGTTGVTLDAKFFYEGSPSAFAEDLDAKSYLLDQTVQRFILAVRVASGMNTRITGNPWEGWANAETSVRFSQHLDVPHGELRLTSRFRPIDFNKNSYRNELTGIIKTGINAYLTDTLPEGEWSDGGQPRLENRTRWGFDYSLPYLIGWDTPGTGVLYEFFLPPR